MRVHAVCVCMLYACTCCMRVFFYFLKYTAFSGYNIYTIGCCALVNFILSICISVFSFGVTSLSLFYGLLFIFLFDYFCVNFFVI